jgi:hypothetical protein
MEKAPFSPKLQYQKNLNFDIFLVLIIRSSSKVPILQKRKKSTERCQKKDFSKFFFKKNCLERLFGIFNISSYSWTKSTIHLFFSALQLHWLLHNQGFSNFSKNAYLPFLDPSTSAGMVFLNQPLIPCY